MHTTDLSAVALAKADVPLSADERLREACLPEDRRRQVAGILAGGLLRLRTPACAALTLSAAGRRPQVAATSDMSSEPACADLPVASATQAWASAGRHVPPQESAESAQKALGLPATARPDPHAG